LSKVHQLFGLGKSATFLLQNTNYICFSFASLGMRTSVCMQIYDVLTKIEILGTKIFGSRSIFKLQVFLTVGIHVFELDVFIQPAALVLVTFY
jgi:hypothetical protein